MTTKIVNTTDFELNSGEVDILLKGMKFCPTPENFNPTLNSKDMNDFCRKLKLTEFFEGFIDNDESIVKPKSSFNPPEGRNGEIDRVTSVLRKAPPPAKKKHPSYNITAKERKAIESLRNNKQLIIKEADKGAAIVLMNRDYYVERAHQILEDQSSYEKINGNGDKKVMNSIKKFIDRYADELTKQEMQYLTNFDFQTSNFYGLPKIHKSKLIAEAISVQKSEVVVTLNPIDLKLRPIIAGPKCPTHRLSHFIDITLQPLTKHVAAYVKDNFDMLRKLPTKMEEGLNLATYDVENLYGNIDHDTGLKAIKFWLSENPLQNTRISKDFILNAIKLILENNLFFFDNNYYRQLKGTAMGTKMAPVYATLVLGFLEKQLYATISTVYNCDISEYFRCHYFRFLDDVLIVYDEKVIPLERVTNLLNNLCSHLNFKLESSGRHVNFLDICIRIVNGVIQTDIYYKPTDSQQYLNFHSNHPRHVKRALPYNLARRICTVVSDNNVRIERLEELSRSLKKCHYPSGLIDDGIRKALSYDRHNLLNPVRRDNEINNNVLVHVSTHNPNYNSQSILIKEMFSELQESHLTKGIFANKKLIQSKRQPPNLKNILTQAKCCTRSQRGVSACNSPRCQLCDVIIGGSSFYFKNANYNFSIPSFMTCDVRNCVYVLECAGCFKYYIGETNNFRLRTNLHKDHTRKNSGLDVNKHIFNCTSDKLNGHNFRIMPFFKVKEDDTTLRKMYENYFIGKLKPELNSIV